VIVPALLRAAEALASRGMHHRCAVSAAPAFEVEPCERGRRWVDGPPKVVALLIARRRGGRRQGLASKT
jgi:hypothetical protein